MNEAPKARLITALLIALSIAAHGTELGCASSARLLHAACGFDSSDDFFTGKAICLDSSDPLDECLADAAGEREETLEECDAVFEARRELCEELDDAPHEPAFGEDFAANFVDPLEIGNTITAHTFFPLVTGNRWVYESTSLDDEGEEVTETITVVVTDKVKLIEGITCVVVNDVVEEDGVVIEDTDDWYAQDTDGNVWYCGEIAQNFETFDGDEPEEPELVDIEGSWKTGRDGSKAGVLIPAEPEVGDVIRQEVAYADAEDVIEILSVDGTQSAPAASCSATCLVTLDFTPLEPDAEEQKFFAPGIGLIVEVDPESGERLELIDFDVQ